MILGDNIREAETAARHFLEAAAHYFAVRPALLEQDCEPCWDEEDQKLRKANALLAASLKKMRDG